jgi:hypothetical protein
LSPSSLEGHEKSWDKHFFAISPDQICDFWETICRGGQFLEVAGWPSLKWLIFRGGKAEAARAAASRKIFCSSELPKKLILGHY